MRGWGGGGRGPGVDACIAGPPMLRWCRCPFALPNQPQTVPGRGRAKAGSVSKQQLDAPVSPGARLSRPAPFTALPPPQEKQLAFEGTFTSQADTRKLPLKGSNCCKSKVQHHHHHLPLPPPQEKKQLVFEGTVGRDMEALGRLTEDDLRFLFG